MTKPTYPVFTENLKPARVELNLVLKVIQTSFHSSQIAL